MLEDLLRNVDPATARSLGLFFDRLARTLLADADRADDARQSLARRRERSAKIKRATRQVTVLMLRGLTKEAAVHQVAELNELDSKRLAANWDIYEKKRSPRLLRNQEILRMAASGSTYSEIGAKYKLSADYVYRVVSGRSLVSRSKGSEGFPNV